VQTSACDTGEDLELQPMEACVPPLCIRGAEENHTSSTIQRCFKI